MDQEKIGNFIKEIRTKNNLTQKQFADKYNVTYQAVSKWENGKNMPDVALIKQISKDFNISLEEIYNGELNINKKKNNFIVYIILSVVFLLIIICIISCLLKNKDFNFKTISTTCNDFNISGNITYNNNKSAIYISNIEYCGGDNNIEYKKIECTLYETSGNIERKIKTYNSDKNQNIKLETFLKQITLVVNNYEKVCKEYSDNSLYLLINATDKSDKTTTYKVPLKIEENCNK